MTWLVLFCWLLIFAYSTITFWWFCKCFLENKCFLVGKPIVCYTEFEQRPTVVLNRNITNCEHSSRLSSGFLAIFYFKPSPQSGIQNVRWTNLIGPFFSNCFQNWGWVILWSIVSLYRTLTKKAIFGFCSVLVGALCLDLDEGIHFGRITLFLRLLWDSNATLWNLESRRVLKRKWSLEIEHFLLVASWWFENHLWWLSVIKHLN